jgi:hypothetical protein
MKNELKETILQRQLCWMKAIRRDDLLSNKPKQAQFIKNGYICGRHFVKGHPTSHYLKNNIDWIPTLNLGYSLSAKQERAEQLGRIRKERIRNREINKVFFFSNFIKYTFNIFTCNFQQNNRQQVITQPLEEAENVEIQVQVQAQSLEEAGNVVEADRSQAQAQPLVQAETVVEGDDIQAQAQAEVNGI